MKISQIKQIQDFVLLLSNNFTFIRFLNVIHKESIHFHSPERKSFYSYLFIKFNLLFFFFLL